ncbi:hypothetical protein Q4511_11010 [Paracoccus sp. 1_MG-2023]|uniref:hypothetical protein n=1 Tax=unclassified Paracoccus (in: a-proteobacteria) TaxID=2688777 RepID=UPI001C091680|nr:MULTISPECIES: hypothetical protein [unclassified Paracoccus (in: a-proteobacteria)]MBU2956047.1 hypothetical protein [Paracoccus sp. C2R09]MDO6669453.1 hypothetical protein [Paracoccus sp. 1_MG-2023]
MRHKDSLIPFLIGATSALLIRQIWVASLRTGPRRDLIVRDAGPDQMRDAPQDWDIVDEEMDESFPASDPPANY